MADKQDLIKQVSGTIYKVRREKGISQKELANLTGIKASNLSRIESGDQNLSLETISKIFEAMDKVPSFELNETPLEYGSDLYLLKLYDETLLSFSLVRTPSGIDVDIKNINEDKKHLFPISLEPTKESLKLWIKHRSVPKHRAYISELLDSFGLSIYDIKGIVDLCKCLSLNDSYWIKNINDPSTFDDVNLYENSFDELIGQIAFLGVVIPNRKKETSPEFTTGGMLRKAWRRPIDKNGIYLYKGGSESITGYEANEPYSEYYASQIAKAMNLNAISYELENWKGILCSSCRLFTSKDVSFVPVWEFSKIQEIDDVLELYKSLGSEYYDQLCDMLVFDEVVRNPDRHFGNFGFLRNNISGNIIAPAPIFDNGQSLFPHANKSDFSDLKTYSNRVFNPYEISWEDLTKKVLGPNQIKKLKKLKEFSFTEHPYCNLPEWRLRALEKFIQENINEILSQV